MSLYENHGLSFQYPENWNLTEQQASGSVEVNLESPKGAVWSVNLFHETEDADDVAVQLLEAMKNEFEDVESFATSEEIAGFEAVGYDLSFFYLDFLVTSKIRCFEADGEVIAVMTEAENRDFDELDIVFKAITTSLLSAPSTTKD